MKKRRIRRTFYILVSVLVFIIIVLMLIPGIARVYIVKNSPDLIGRQIELDRLKIGWFRCSVKAEGFVMYEAEKKDTFVSFQELYVNFNPWNLLRNEFAFSEIKLVKPFVSVVFLDSIFNFDDLIPPSDTTDTDTSATEVKYLVRNFSLSEGFIRYEDRKTNNINEIKSLNIQVPEISWNSSESDVGLAFMLGDDGKVAIDGVLNQAEERYQVSLKTQNIDLEPFEGFVKPFIDISSLQGRLSTDLQLSGSISDPMNLVVRGEAALNRFMIHDPDNREFCFLDQLTIRLDSIDVGNEAYHLGMIELVNPRFMAVLEPGTTNIDRMLAPYYADTLTSTDDTLAVQADTIEEPASSMHYSIRRLTIRNGQVALADNTLNRPFHYEIGEINLNMESFSDIANNIPVSFSMKPDHTASFTGDLVLDMANTSNMTFKGILKDMNMISFSPYSEYFLARPVTRGVFNYNGTLNMTSAKLENRNRVKIVNLEMGKKTGDATAYKVPVGLALYVLKDRKGLIQFDLPVTGNPSSPAFKLRKVILKTLEEFLLKTAAAPFNALGKMFGADPETLREIRFGWLQDTLGSEQVKQLGSIAGIIQQRPEFRFTFTQTTHLEKEMELLAAKQAKLRFVREKMLPGVDEQDLLPIADTVSYRNPAFRNFIGAGDKVSDEEAGVQCIRFIGKENLTDALYRLLEKRRNLLADYFIQQGIPAGSVTFAPLNLQNLPEALKNPGFRIEVTLK